MSTLRSRHIHDCIPPTHFFSSHVLYTSHGPGCSQIWFGRTSFAVWWCHNAHYSLPDQHLLLFILGINLRPPTPTVHILHTITASLQSACSLSRSLFCLYDCYTSLGHFHMATASSSVSAAHPELLFFSQVLTCITLSKTL